MISPALRQRLVDQGIILTITVEGPIGYNKDIELRTAVEILSRSGFGVLAQSDKEALLEPLSQEETPVGNT